MTETAASFLTPWSNFYIMLGSSAGALTGLMFVVITLVQGAERERNTRDGVAMATFSTPTVAHFCAALLISAIMAVPWKLLIHPAILLGLTGLLGLAYILRVLYLAKRLTGYTPDAEDWTWFAVMPFLAYGAVFVGALLLRSTPVQALFWIAASAALLIFIGIRNAWDIVTYLAINGPPDTPSNKES